MHKASSGLFNIYNIERKISKHLSIVFWWIMEAIGGSSKLLGRVFTLDQSMMLPVREDSPLDVLLTFFPVTVYNLQHSLQSKSDTDQ